MKFKTFLFLAACGGGVWYYYHDKEATPAPTKEDAPITETQTVACDIKPAIPVEQAMDMLVRYGIMDTSPSSRVKKQSDEIQYHFMMYKDGMEDIKAYPYIDAIISMYGSLKDKKLPIKCLEAFCAKGCVIQDVATCCAAAFRMPDKDDELLTFILEQGIKANTHSINSTDKDGWTPIMYATHCYENSAMCRKIFEILIEMGADVNHKNKDGWSSFTLAMRNQTLLAAKDGVYNRSNLSADAYVAVVTALIKAGANINEKSTNGIAPLMMAIHNGGGVSSDSCERIINALLEAGAELNITDKEGNTPLMYLLDNTGGLTGDSYERLAKKFISYKADVNYRNQQKWSALTWLLKGTCANGKIPADTCQRLVSELTHAGLVVNIDDIIEDAMPVYYAMHLPQKEKEKVISSIVENFANNAVSCELNTGSIDREGHTLITYALTGKYSHRAKSYLHVIIDAFIKAKVDINVKDEKGMTALHYITDNASYADPDIQIRIMDLLIAAGADVNARNNKGQTPLMLLFHPNTASNNAIFPKPACLEMAKMLINSGADVNASDQNKRTPLMYALDYTHDINDIEPLELLLNQGANAAAKDNNGKTAAHAIGGFYGYMGIYTSIEEKAWAEAVLKLLKEYRGTNSTRIPSYNIPTVQQSSNSRKHEVEELIDTVEKMSARDSTMKLYQKRLLTLLPLIRDGESVDVTLAETKGNTALHYACGMGYADLVQWLVEHGANINKRTNAGKTPLDCTGSGEASRIREILANSSKVSDFHHGSDESGDPDELNNLGLEYQYGKNGKPQNYSEAARHFRLAAEQGHAGAQNNLGFCYHNGWGVPKDMSQAAMWYKRSADQGNAWGQSNYGTCLEFGWGVRKNVSAAIEMYRRAAAQGHASAKKHLKRHGITM